MNAHDLYSALLQKDYQPPKCGQHIAGESCCAQSVFEAWEEAKIDPAVADGLLRNHLELDAPAVFRAFHGEGLLADNPAAENALAKWQHELILASYEQVHGHIPMRIDFLLRNP